MALTLFDLHAPARSKIGWQPHSLFRDFAWGKSQEVSPRMIYKNLFPRLVASCCRPRLSLFCAVFAIIIGLTANVTFGQSQRSRPVARLITSPFSAHAEVAQTRAARVAPVASAAHSLASSSAMSMERRAFELINEQRRANGLRPFEWDEDLCRMARALSGQMASQNFFNHVTPDGRDMTARAHSNGIMHWRALGENIAYNQGFDDPAGFAVERWMNSAKHRDNILNGYFTRSGIGVARSSDGRVFFTQVFITR